MNLSPEIQRLHDDVVTAIAFFERHRVKLGETEIAPTFLRLIELLVADIDRMDRRARTTEAALAHEADMHREVEDRLVREREAEAHAADWYGSMLAAADPASDLGHVLHIHNLMLVTESRVLEYYTAWKMRARAAEATLKELSECACGCPMTQHESYGEDGESCGNDNHDCVRVFPAVALRLRGLEGWVRDLEAELDACHDDASSPEYQPSDVTDRLRSAETRAWEAEVAAAEKHGELQRLAADLDEAQERIRTLEDALMALKWRDGCFCANDGAPPPGHTRPCRNATAAMWHRRKEAR